MGTTPSQGDSVGNMSDGEPLQELGEFSVIGLYRRSFDSCPSHLRCRSTTSSKRSGVC